LLLEGSAALSTFSYMFKFPYPTLLSLIFFFTLTFSFAQTSDEANTGLEKNVDRFFDLERYEKAIPLLEELSARYETSKKWRRYTDASLKLAIALSYADSKEKALARIDKALALALKKLPDRDSLTGKVLFQKGEILLESGQLEEASEAYAHAFPILIQHQIWYKATLSQIGISVSYYYQGLSSQMEAPLLRATSLQQSYLPESYGLTSTINSLFSALYDAKGDYDGALQIALDGLELQSMYLADNPGDSSLLSTHYNNIGAYYYSKGDYEQAIFYYRNAIQITERFDPNAPSIPSICNNLALAYIRAGHLEESLDILNKNEAMLSALSGQEAAEDLSILYSSIARSYLIQKNSTQALAYARKALQLDQSAPGFAYLSRRRMAEAYLLQQQAGKAIPYLEEALKLPKDKAPLNNAVLLRLISKAQLMLDMPEEALNSSQKALQLLYPQIPVNHFYLNPETKQPVERLESIRILQQKAKAMAAYAYRRKAEPRILNDALATYQLSFHWSSQARQEYLNASSKQILIEETHQAYEKAINTALRLYNLTGEKRLQHLAFELAEQNKAIVMQERFQDNQAKVFAQIPDSLRQQENELKRDLAFYERKLADARYAPDTNQAKLDFWNAKVLSLRRAVNDITKRYEEQFPLYYELKYRLPATAVEEIQASVIPGHTLLLEFFVGEEEIFVFRLGADDIAVRSFSKPTDFSQQVQNLHKLISTPPEGSASLAFGQFNHLSSGLHQLLFDDLLTNQPEGSRLIIIPDQVLSYLPFEVLLVDNEISNGLVSYGQLPYLFSKYRVGYSYSARMLLSLSSLENNLLKNPRCLAFAPDFTGQQASNRQYGTITGNQEELEAIRQFFGGQFLFGKDALESVFKSRGSDFPIIHLATHGLADEQAPLFSRLAFQPAIDTTQDGLLHTFELYDMLLRARLVVLSACETGFGTFAYGEEVMSLASGFMHTGCHNVTQSLWEAQDQSTAQIMESYYRYLAEGKAVEEALRQAKLDYLQQPLAQKHPFYWAAFINIGDGQAFVKPGGDNWYFWLLGFLALLFAGGVWYMWEK